MSGQTPDSPLKQVIASAKETAHKLEHPNKHWGRAILDFLNPAYHVRRIKEDLAATKSALAKRHQLLTGEISTADLPEIFRGKLMGVLFATGWTNLVGLGLAYWIQKATSNPWFALFGTPVTCYISTAIGFQIGWWLDNRDIYRKTHADPAHRFWELERDLLPVHKASLPMAVVFSFTSLFIGAPVLFVIQLINANFARELPAPMLVMIAEFLFVGSAFVRFMGDFFDKYSYKLAIKYRRYLCDDHKEHEEAEARQRKDPTPAKE